MVAAVRAIIVALAVLAAAVLVLLGIREIRTGRGRHGLFVTTLLAALGAAGCNAHAKVRSPADAPDEVAGQAVQAVTVVGEEESARMAELAKTAEWAEFKALWKKLDWVRPPEGAEGTFAGEYYGSITYEQAAGLRTELGYVIGELGKPGTRKLVGDLELQLLETICTKRINYLEYGLQSMMTRMMPPPMTTEKEDSIRDLERHIDVLVKLRESGKVSGEEFEAALAIVEDDVKTYSVLDALSESYFGFHSPPLQAILEEKDKPGHAANAAESIIAAFEKDYAAFDEKAIAAKAGADAAKEIAAQYEKSKEAIDQLKIVLPFVAELVSDLEG